MKPGTQPAPSASYEERVTTALRIMRESRHDHDGTFPTVDEVRGALRIALVGRLDLTIRREALIAALPGADAVLVVAAVNDYDRLRAIEAAAKSFLALHRSKPEPGFCNGECSPVARLREALP